MISVGQAPLNFHCLLASDWWSSFRAFADKLLIWLSSDLVGKLIKVLPWPDLLTFGNAPLNSCCFLASYWYSRYFGAPSSPHVSGTGESPVLPWKGGYAKEIPHSCMKLFFPSYLSVKMIWELFRKTRKPKANFVHLLVYLNHFLWFSNWISAGLVLVDKQLLF